MRIARWCVLQTLTRHHKMMIAWCLVQNHKMMIAWWCVERTTCGYADVRTVHHCIIEWHGDRMVMCLSHTVGRITKASSSRITIERCGPTYSTYAPWPRAAPSIDPKNCAIFLGRRTDLVCVWMCMNVYECACMCMHVCVWVCMHACLQQRPTVAQRPTIKMI